MQLYKIKSSVLANNMPRCCLCPIAYQDVAVVLVVVEGAVVDNMTRPRPGIGQQVLGEAPPTQEVLHVPELHHTLSINIAVHTPHLRGEGRVEGDGRGEDIRGGRGRCGRGRDGWIRERRGLSLCDDSRTRPSGS